MPISGFDTRSKLIDPAMHGRGWTEDLLRREKTAGAIEIGQTGPRRRAMGRQARTRLADARPGMFAA